MRAGRVAGFGNFVLLAGPNGAGKTRLLKLIRECGAKALTLGERRSMEDQVSDFERNISHQRTEAQRLIDAGSAPNSNEVVRTLRYVDSWEGAAKGFSSKLNDDLIFERDSDQKPLVVIYDVERTSLTDWKQIDQAKVQFYAKSISSEFGIRIVSEAGLSAVRSLINNYVYASHRGSSNLPELDAKIRDLKNLLRDFVGVELDWDDDGDPTFFGLPIASAGLSDGQLVLFQIALSLFFQRGEMSELILLMDEPERHLHPLAAINLIDEVRRKCPNAQIWIATHSVHILAHANPRDIWYVKDGGVEHVGARSLEVLHSLVGGDDGINEILEFLALPAQNALVGFAAQCLLPPAVVDTAVGDPQTVQITGVLENLRKADRPLRILDFGIGKGRLLSELLKAATDQGAQFRDLFDYYGIDLCSIDENREICDMRFSAAYGSGRSRYFSLMSDLSNSLNERSFDVVIMCNTLHEILPKKWLAHFGSNGDVSRLLREDGYLLIVEDQLLPVGERAHKYGYLVLDAPEIRALTNTSNEDSSFVTVDCDNPRYSGRLKAHLVPSKAVCAVTSESCKQALAKLKERSLDSANELAGEQFEPRKVRKYAFWCHQHVNASLALKDMYGSEWVDS